MTDPSGGLPFGVVGATGQQGGAVVDALLAAGAAVRALVRDPGSDRSQALARRGVAVVRGDQDQPETLDASLTGLAGLFMMSALTSADDPGGEVRRGSAIVDAAEQARVPRVVYSSVGGAERHTGIPHFENKRRVEQRLEESTLAAQYVRPAYFMDNWAGQLTDGEPEELVLRAPLPADVALQMVAVRDIGVVAAAALLDPSALGAGALEIAGDSLTGDEVAARVGEHLKRPTRYEPASLDVLGDDDDMRAMFRWLAELPAYQADFARTRQLVSDVWDFDAWLAARDT